MPALASKLNPRSEEFKANAAAMRVARRRPERETRTDRAGWRRSGARQTPRARQVAAARARRDAARPGRAVPRDRTARRAEHVQGARRHRRRARRGPDRRHRPHQRRRVRGRVQRRHGERRYLLPDDGEEAPACTGDRAAKPAALHLPRRFRRRELAEPGRGVPRPRALRPHLLQPGEHERAGHSADRGRDGLVHRRRRVHAGDERRVDHREEPGDDFSRRSAAGESGHR